MFTIQAPTLKGEIKKARASNYTWQRVISEFIDNSNDVLIKSEQSQKVIQIKLNLDTNDTLHSICISDNFIEGIKDHNIWSWTYERNREKEDCGEFGTGFKSGSVNIASELLVLTRADNEYTRMRAEWDEMSIRNDYTPTSDTIPESDYKVYHPFDVGSTFVLKQLIKANLPPDVDYIRDELVSHISVVYKKLLKMNKDINIYVDDILINHKSVLNEMDSKKIHMDEKIPKSMIYVYKNKDKYVPIVMNGSNYHKIKFKDENMRKKPNGNLNIADMRGAANGAEIVNISHYNNRDEYILIDVMFMESRCIYHYCKEWLLNDKERPDPNGNISLIRKNRILSDKCSAIHYRGDSYATYQYHELTYNDRRMDNPLGVQFNKNTDNKIQSEELEAAILWTQKLHEKTIMTNEGNCGQGHKKHMDVIQKKYNSFKMKLQLNILSELFNTWKTSVNWEEYDKKVKQRQIIEQTLDELDKSTNVELNDTTEIDEVCSETGNSVLSYFSVSSELQSTQPNENVDGVNDTLEVLTNDNGDNDGIDESEKNEINESIEKSVQDMTDEEIIRYVSDENTNPTLEEIKYIINRGDGNIDDHEENQDLCELFENERQAMDGIGFAFEFCPDFARYLLNDYL